MLLDAIVIDFETRSRCNLITDGSYNYASDPSTDILCMAAYDMADNRTWLWFPSQGALPIDLVEAIEDAEFVAAHNANFDRGIWECVAVEDYGFPELPLDKWYCTAAQCRVNAIPASLNNASEFTSGKKQKMAAGSSLIKLLSIPNKDGTFNESPVALIEMGKYCLQDTVATVGVIKATRLMTQQEHEDYVISERINDSGVKVDIELAALCCDQAQNEAAEMGDLLNTLTDGAVKKVTQVARVKKWFMDVVPDEIIKKYLTRKLDDGTTKISFDKSTRARLYEAAQRGMVEIPPNPHAILTIVEDGNKSSVAKFDKMIHLSDVNDRRVRGAYIYAGASQTKRYSAKGLQVHNFRRESFKPDEVEAVKLLLLQKKAAMIDCDSVMEALSKLLRPALIPEEGSVFVVCDWAAIEGRCLPWLSDSRGGEQVLDIFRNDEDIYMHTAEAMGIDDRQTGKVATLALGFQGGVNAFNSMARNYGLVMSDDDAQEIVDKWREANGWAGSFWKKLERAAMNAVSHPRVWFPVGRLSYFYSPNLLGGTLICLLPDDSIIQYPMAKAEDIEMPWGGMKSVITYAKGGLTPAAGESEWPRSTLYGGLLCENATQATAAVLLRDALKACYYDGLDVALHVHDEIVLESKFENVESDMAKLQKIMETAPAWAEGLPLKAVPEVKERYGK